MHEKFLDQSEPTLGSHIDADNDQLRQPREVKLVRTDVDEMLMKKKDWSECIALTSIFSVELPGIEPVSGCWWMRQTDYEQRNDMHCDSAELTSVDSECAQNVPS